MGVPFSILLSEAPVHRGLPFGKMESIAQLYHHRQHQLDLFANVAVRTWGLRRLHRVRVHRLTSSSWDRESGTRRVTDCLRH